MGRARNKDKGKGRHQQSKGNKIKTKCRVCKIDMVSWSLLDPICIRCKIWK